jgi:hypothetical protein
MCRIFCGGFFFFETAGSILVVFERYRWNLRICCVVFAVMGDLRLVWVLIRGGGI